MLASAASGPAPASVPLSVSVALCTHNGAAFLALQLRSILRQTTLPNQLVVSDDASTDGTVAVARAEVERFRAERPDWPLECLVLENSPALGVVRNFEQAVLACTGELVALCDQDDLWARGRLERVVAEFTRRPELTLLHSDARLVDDAGSPLGQNLFQAIEFTAAEQREVHSGRGYDTLLRRNVVTGATTVFRRNLLQQAAPFATGWVHDEWLAILAAALGRVDFLDEQLVDYRQHDSNQIGAKRLSLRGKAGRLGEPRRERNQRLVARAESLVTRLAELGELVPQEALSLAEGKLEHERRRRALPSARWRRIGPVLLAGVSGRYRRFGRMRYDLLRDLAQPDA